MPLFDACCSWLDVNLRPPGAGGYSWWGFAQPDNLGGKQWCAVSNLTAAPAKSAGKWFDQDCDTLAPSICRLTRGWPASAGNESTGLELAHAPASLPYGCSAMPLVGPPTCTCACLLDQVLLLKRVVCLCSTRCVQLHQCRHRPPVPAAYPASNALRCGGDMRC